MIRHASEDAAASGIKAWLVHVEALKVQRQVRSRSRAGLGSQVPSKLLKTLAMQCKCAGRAGKTGAFMPRGGESATCTRQYAKTRGATHLCCAFHHACWAWGGWKNPLHKKPVTHLLPPTPASGALQHSPNPNSHHHTKEGTAAHQGDCAAIGPGASAQLSSNHI